MLIFDICFLRLTQLWQIVSLHIRSMWETTVMHKQVSGWTVNFCPNSPVYPFLELKTRIPPPPHFGKLQIWDDQSLLRNIPPFRKTSDLGWPKFTLEYPPISENFRFGMTKVYSGIPLPPILENFRFGMTKVYSRIPLPPILENFRFGMTKVYSGIPLPPILENFRFGMTKVYSGIPLPPILENFRFGMTKVYSWIPTPAISENFRFGMTKVYSGIPPLMEIVRESKSEIFRIPRVTTCGDFIQPG